MLPRYNETQDLRVFTLSQRCGSRFQCSGIWCWGKAGARGPLYTWRWKQYFPPKLWRPIIQRMSVVFQESRILNTRCT